MANLRSEVDHLYTTLDANMKTRGRTGSLGNLGSLAGVAELDSAGVYFLFEPGETREPGAARVVRAGKSTNLRSRLRDHSLNSDKSIFLTLVWAALAYKHNQTAFYPFLKTGFSAIPNPLRQLMRDFEFAVVKPYAAQFDFTWIPIDSERQRNKIELWATVLLSNYWRQGAPIDAASNGWLAKNLNISADPSDLKVVRSGLWSKEFVDLDLTDGCCFDFEHLVRSGP